MRSSLDNYATDIANNRQDAGGTISLADALYQNVGSAITFKLYAWGASAAGGTFSINDFTFNGAVKSNCVLPAIPVANSNTSPQTDLVYPSGFTANWNSITGTGYEVDVSQYPTFVVGGTPATDLFFSEYVEGSANNKFLEIYNGTSGPVNLADYTIRLFANGAGAATQTLALTGSLASGSTIVYGNSNSTVYGGTFIKSAAVDLAINFNGNDAIGLFKISTNAYVDIFGRIGEDPGTAWTVGGNTTINKTLVRNANIITGIKTNPPLGSGFATLASEWTQLSQDDVSNLGTHTFTGGSSPSYLPNYGPVSIGSSTTLSNDVTGLAESSTFYYRVRAKNACGLSNNSNVVKVTTTDYSVADYRSLQTGQYSTLSTWEYFIGFNTWKAATQLPATTNNILIKSGNIVTAASGITVGTGKTLTVNGSLALGTNVVSGAGSFILSDDATLSIGSAAGITSSGATGNIQVAGTRTFSSLANYVYNGTSPQVTGNGLPASISGLTIDNTVSLNNSVTVNGPLTLTSGSLAINSNTLTLAGTISATAGTLKGSSASNLIINGSGNFGTLQFDQSVDSLSNVLKSLTIGTSGSVTLGNQLYITDVLTSSAGTLTTGGHLTIRSTSIAGTARVAPVLGTISGNVTVERFMSKRRSFRLVSSPVTTTSSIRANWMEGGLNPSPYIRDNPHPGYGTQITGIGGNANGFDPSLSNYPSLFVYNATTQHWDSVLNTNGTIKAGNPMRLFIRGDRNHDLSANPV